MTRDYRIVRLIGGMGVAVCLAFVMASSSALSASEKRNEHEEHGKREWLLRGNYGTNPALDFIGTTDALPFAIRTNNSARLVVAADGSTSLLGNASVAGALGVGGAMNVGGALTTTNLTVSGTATLANMAINGAFSANAIETNVLTIKGGSDLAEPFTVEDGRAAPGMVVSIDAERPGALRVADHPYDRAVAGIVSGANGIRPGLTLQQRGTMADGNVQVALTGRVWVNADADANGSIRPGDLLTTSSTAGHAMRAEPGKAAGATLGKAMSPLSAGRGLVLVLVGLQ